jgi:cyclic beta-1,2-glucan synthetase
MRRCRADRDRSSRARADLLADRLLAPTRDLSRDDRLGLDQTPVAAFAVQLVQRLRDQDPAVTPALQWLDERLAAQHTTADEMVREEHQSQGAMNVTVRNAITSMRLLSAFDWADSSRA